MKNWKWLAPAMYTATGILIGSTALTATTAFAKTSDFRAFTSNIFQNGQMAQSAQAVQYNGTNFFGIWYLNQLLTKDGIHATWDGKNLTLTNVPVQQTSQMTVSTSSNTSNPVIANSIDVGGVTYVPLTTVQTLLQQLGAHIHLADGPDGKPATKPGSGDQQTNINIRPIVAHLQNAVTSLTKPAKDDNSNVGDTVKIYADAISQLQIAYTEVTDLQSAMKAYVAASTSSTSSTSGTVSAPTASQITDDIATLGKISSSLQSDWQAINQIAITTLSTATNNVGSGTTSTSTSTSTTAPTTLAGVGADLQVQIAALNTLQPQPTPPTLGAKGDGQEGN